MGVGCHPAVPGLNGFPGQQTLRSKTHTAPGKWKSLVTYLAPGKRFGSELRRQHCNSEGEGQQDDQRDEGGTGKHLVQIH